jgi:hypothetical protein
VDELEKRLVRCFRAAFPRYNGNLELLEPSATTDWDSLASVTLLTLIQDEFNVEVAQDDLNALRSFQSTEVFLRKRIGNSSGRIDSQ